VNRGEGREDGKNKRLQPEQIAVRGKGGKPFENRKKPRNWLVIMKKFKGDNHQRSKKQQKGRKRKR